MNVSSVSPEDKNNFISKFRSDNLLYLVKARILVAYPVTNQWNEYCSGNLALHTNSNNCLFFTVVDHNNTSKLFSHELYKKFPKHYQKLSPDFYAFPSERCIIGIQFLLEAEAKNMESQIHKFTPKSNKKTGLKGIFSKKKKSNAIVISMPEDVGLKSGVQWDPEEGYQIDGSMEDLPKEHLEFMYQQGYVPESK